MVIRLVQVMAGNLFGDKPLPKWMLTYRQLDPPDLQRNLKQNTKHTNKSLTHCSLVMHTTLSSLVQVMANCMFIMIPLPEAILICLLTNWPLADVETMAWCCQATSNYLSQCLHKSMLPYFAIGPQ